MDFVEHLKTSVDIVRVVGEYVRLRKAGPTRYVGLCPFHSEKSPSFGVHAVQQFYKCFGCGAGGDVLKFVMEIEQISFYEALRLLAERNGIPMPKRSEYSDPDTRLRAALFQMHELAGDAFRTTLAGAAGAEARAYLEKRGTTAEVAEQFGIGYAERSGRALVRLFEQHKIAAEHIEASGLVGKRQDNSLYDRFRHRLIFPIHNETGKIIAFGGRALAPGDEPKYLNSPETPIYKKSSVLYNLHRAKEGIRRADRVVLVEGYMDAIGVSTSGIREVVATCGTALTPQQVQTMRRHSGRVVVNFDPDAAGANAAERSINLLLDESLHVRILELDGGLDPDDYCRQRGADAYRARLDDAKTYFYWLADRARARFDMRNADGRVEALKFLLPAVQRLGDKLERLAVANDVAGYLGVDAGAVLENFRHAVVDRRERTVQAPPDLMRADEKLLLRLLLSSEEARQRILPDLKDVSAVQQFASRRIFQAILAAHEAGTRAAFNDIHTRLEEADRELLARAALQVDTDDQELSLEQGMACLESLKRSDLQARRSELKTRVRDAERAGNLGEAIRLAGELQRLERPT